MSGNENMTPAAMMKLVKEIKSLCTSPPEGIKVSFNEENMTILHADIDGPVGTPYENGNFRIKLVFTGDYPHSPPKGCFLTKIFHPNVQPTTGEICVNTLKKDWTASLGLRHVLIVVRCLLIVPNPESALNEDAGKLMLDNYDDFCRRAAVMTRIHAKKSTTSSSSSKSSPESDSAMDGENVSNSIISPQESKKSILSDNNTGVASSTTSVTGNNTTKKLGVASTGTVVDATKKRLAGAEVKVEKAKDEKKKTLKRL